MDHISEASRFRVLVVDDNEPSALTLTWAVELYGCEVETCFNGPSAIDRARNFRPDFVLLDIGMPVMDGYEVCRQLKADPELDGICVIAQSGWGDPETRRRAAEAGFDHHLTKPVDLTTLSALLK